ncbi:hypothetical protein D9M72_500950 [compost metagenome]
MHQKTVDPVGHQFRNSAHWRCNHGNATRIRLHDQNGSAIELRRQDEHIQLVQCFFGVFHKTVIPQPVGDPTGCNALLDHGRVGARAEHVEIESGVQARQPPRQFDEPNRILLT